MDRVTRSKPRFATIRVRNAAAILPTLRELGAEPERVLRAAGIEPAMFSDPDYDLPFTALDRLVGACVKATGCESFGLSVGARMRPTAVGLTGPASMHAPTVRDAVQILSSTLKTSNTGVSTTLDVRGQSASFQYVVTAPNIESADQIVDAAVAMIVNTMRRLCGPVWRPIRVRLTRDPPRDKAPFAQFFKVPVEYAALTAGVIFRGGARLAGSRSRPGHREDSRPAARRGGRQRRGRLRLRGQVGVAGADRRGRIDARQRLPRARRQCAHARPSA